MISIFQHEVKYYFKNKKEAIYLYSYFISILLLVPFGLPMGMIRLPLVAPVTLLIAITSMTMLGGMTLFRRDHEQGRLEAYQLLPLSLESIVFAKWLAFYLFMLMPSVLMLPVFAMLFGLSTAMLGPYLMAVVLAGAALSLLTTLAAAITTGLGKAGAVSGLIVLPWSIPVMIYAAAYCRDGANLLFFVGFNAFLLPLTCLVGAFSIRAAN